MDFNVGIIVGCAAGRGLLLLLLLLPPPPLSPPLSRAVFHQVPHERVQRPQLKRSRRCVGRGCSAHAQGFISCCCCRDGSRGRTWTIGSQHNVEGPGVVQVPVRDGVISQIAQRLNGSELLLLLLRRLLHNARRTSGGEAPQRRPPPPIRTRLQWGRLRAENAVERRQPADMAFVVHMDQLRAGRWRGIQIFEVDLRRHSRVGAVAAVATVRLHHCEQTLDALVQDGVGLETQGMALVARCVGGALLAPEVSDFRGEPIRLGDVPLVPILRRYRLASRRSAVVHAAGRRHYDAGASGPQQQVVSTMACLNSAMSWLSRSQAVDLISTRWLLETPRSKRQWTINKSQ